MRSRKLLWKTKSLNPNGFQLKTEDIYYVNREKKRAKEERRGERGEEMKTKRNRRTDLLKKRHPDKGFHFVFHPTAVDDKYNK